MFETNMLFCHILLISEFWMTEDIDFLDFWLDCGSILIQDF